MPAVIRSRAMGLLVPRPEPNAGSENHVAFLALERVSKHYGPMAAVDDVALTIQKGEFVSLLGPTGCGKTTTLQMIAGLSSRRRAHHPRWPRHHGDKTAQTRPGNRVSELRALPAHDRREERRLRPRDARGCRRRAQGSASRMLAGALPASRTAIPASCPAASASALPLRVRW